MLLRSRFLSFTRPVLAIRFRRFVLSSVSGLPCGVHRSGDQHQCSLRHRASLIVTPQNSATPAPLSVVLFIGSPVGTCTGQITISAPGSTRTHADNSG